MPRGIWKQLTTAPYPRDGEVKTFIVTHPFHPLFQKEYEIVDVRQTWGLKRVYYYDAKRKLKSFLISWTSLQDPDPFIICAEGRSPFRIQDLIELSSLIEKISAAEEKKNV